LENQNAKRKKNEKALENKNCGIIKESKHIDNGNIRRKKRRKGHEEMFEAVMSESSPN
jgi:hypothetical protein